MYACCTLATFVLHAYIFQLTSASWSEQLQTEKITVLKLETFQPGKFKNAALTEIQKSDVRVIVTLAYAGIVCLLAPPAMASADTRHLI